MKRHTIITFVILIFAGILSVRAEDSSSNTKKSILLALSRDRFKAFWIFPISSTLSTKNSWVEIRECEPSGACNRLFKRIPIGKVLNRGSLKLDTDFHGIARLYYVDKHVKDPGILIASREVNNDRWVLPMELCKSTFEQVDCKYSIEGLDDGANKSLHLKIMFAKGN